MNRAIVAMPVDVDGWADGTDYRWRGRIIEEPLLFVETDDGDMDLPISKSVLTPDILGRLLVSNYWTYEANIETWWQNDVLVDGEADIVDEPPGEINWVYIGTIDRLIVLTHQDDGWWQGAVTWAGDPVDIDFEPVDA
jgi:hypothetical protein